MNIVPPIIIIGMSRSGTGMLTRILEELGLFVGTKKEENHEAIFFEQLNKWILGQCSGGLENPGAIKFLLENREARVLFVDFIRYIMKTPRVLSFLGWRKYLKYRTPTKLDFPWGWKDPRNTFTLPIWLDIFPEAKVIHICRHGVDVANSLSVRQEKGLSRLRGRHQKFKSLYWFYLMHKFVIKKRIFVDLRCSTMEEALLMWEEYVREARSQLLNFKNGSLEIKYEDMLTEPSSVIKLAATFCELQISDNDIKKVSRHVNSARSYAYRNYPELVAFAEKASERLKANGY